jgi:hypothetical protein
MKKLFKSFLFLILLNPHISATADQETEDFCRECCQITKHTMPRRISDFQELGFNQQSAEIFSRFMTLAYPGNIEVIANYLCGPTSQFTGLQNIDSSEEKKMVGLAIKAILAYQGPIYIYAYGILRAFPHDKLKPLVTSMLELTKPRFQAATGENVLPPINIELFVNILGDKDSIKQDFSTLLGNILKDCCNAQIGTVGTMNDLSFEEFSSYLFWKVIFDTCDANTVSRIESGNFMFVRF